ncbi:MAG: response regulator [Acidobacteriota bacterium]|nr:response regulator [Acidobacteriota bacterium]
MRVLIVDDSPVMRRYVGRTLRLIREDVNIDEAANGAEAFYHAVLEQPDLIITDLNMPRMRGEELVQRLHTAPELRHIPVLVLSADRSEQRSRSMKRAGAVGYMTKPVTPEMLKESLAGLFKGKL